MKTWAVVNQKGGVGKTTTAVNLAGLLAREGKETLLVDLDPHGSLTSYLGYDPDEMEYSAYTLFQTAGKSRLAITAVIRETKMDKLSFMPSSTALATLDRQLGTQKGMGLVISQALQILASKYEHVIIDCPPMLGVLMVNALAASDLLLLPVQTEFLALKGLERMVHTLGMIQKSLNKVLPYAIVPTMYDQRTRASHDSLSYLQEKYAKRLAHAIIPIDTQFRDASRAGMPLTLLHPNARGSKAYEQLLNQLLGREPVKVQESA